MVERIGSSLLLNYTQLSNESMSNLGEALAAFESCVCFPEPSEIAIPVIRLAITMNLLILLGSCKDCLQEIGVRPIPGRLGRKLLLLSTQSPPEPEDEDIMEIFLGYSDIIFMNRSALLRMGPQIAAGRKFLPFKEATQYFKKDKLPYLKAQTLIGAFYNCSPLIIMKGNKNEVPVKEYDGVEIFILNELSKAMNFTWALKEIVGVPWGNYNNVTWVGKEGGVIGSMLQQESDIGLCGFWIRKEQISFVEITSDYSQMNMVFILPRKFNHGKWKKIFTPFSNKLWICVACTVAASFLALHFLSKISGEGRELHEWIFLVVGLFLGCSPLPCKGPTMFRVAALSVSVAALLVSTLYSSAVVSHLTSPPKFEQSQTVEDMVNKGFLWTYTMPITNAGKLLRLENKWHRRIAELYQISSDYKRKFNQDKYPVICKLVADFPLTAQSDTADLEDAYVLPETINTFLIGIAFRKGSPLANHASRVLDRLKSSGIIQKAMSEISIRIGGIDKPSKKGPKPLTMKSLQGAFLILVFGDVLACISLVAEKMFSCLLIKKIN